MNTAFTGAIASGLIFSLMALGVYFTFRILKFPDLTVDGSFTTGGALAAIMITHGQSPWLALVFALIAGTIAGALTGLLHTKGKVDPLLSSILVMIALYSINLRIMGKANVGLLGETTLFSQWAAIVQSPLFSTIVPMAIIAAIIALLLGLFFRTEIGLAVRATGDNESMIKSFSVNTDHTKILALSLSNGLVALSGAFMAQYQGYADISMGIGMIVIGLASVIIGEFIFGHSSIGRTLAAVIGGTILYRIILAVALRLDLNPVDLKLMTACIVAAALVSPRILAKWKSKRKQAKQRTHINSPLGGEPHAES